MITVWKFSLEVGGDYNEVTVPSDWKFAGADAGIDPGVVDVWLIVDTNSLPKQDRFLITGTGQEAPYRAAHLATVRHPSSQLVWHVWGNEPRLGVLGGENQEQEA